MAQSSNHDGQGIEVYTENPFYWQFDGGPTRLLGASDNDNLFQSPQVEEELDRLREAGGNYVRCTMSSRDPGDLWPYSKDKAGRRPRGALQKRFDYRVRS